MSEMAATQGGVITAAQCRAIGVDDPAVRRLLAAGLWTRARRGIYRRRRVRPVGAGAGGLDANRSGRRDPAHHAECAALLACLARPAVVSHLSAVRLLGLPLPPWRLDPLACITRRGPAPTNDPLLGDVHVVDYDDADVVDVAGVPVLAGARLVLDCCDVLAPDSALAVADAALAPRAHHPCRPADRAASAVHAVARRRSDRRAGRRAGRPPGRELVRVELAVVAAGGRVAAAPAAGGLHRQARPRARVDMLFDRVVGEADGAGKYDEPGALFAEKQREDWLRDVHRLEVVRWVPAEMRSRRGRAEVAARFARAAARVS